VGHGLEALCGPAIGLPLVPGWVAWLECRLIDEPHAQQTCNMFFGDVVSAQADTRMFARGRWSFRDDNADRHTLHHLGGGLFALPARTPQAERLKPLHA
jgi:flavin reductase (DIM6/NTAB) family NADH-FMN oxidoreductase RutF